MCTLYSSLKLFPVGSLYFLTTSSLPSSISCTPNNHYSYFLWFRVLAVIEIPCKWNHVLCFHDWHVSLSRISQTFIHIVTCFIISYFLRLNVFITMHSIIIIRNLGFPCLLAIQNSDTINMDIHIFIWNSTSV